MAITIDLTLKIAVLLLAVGQIVFILFSIFILAKLARIMKKLDDSLRSASSSIEHFKSLAARRFIPLSVLKFIHKKFTTNS